MVRWWAAMTLCAAALGGCSFDRSGHAGSCAQSEQCAQGQECYRGFCVAALGSELSGMPCDSEQSAQACFDGEQQTLDVGACKAGTRTCVGGFYTACVAQVTAQPESCNGVDDDCNGVVDDLALETCATNLPGECRAGTPVCQGAFAFCQPAVLPGSETCNGLDDDCDGVTDDVSPVACYPANVGCSIGPAGRPNCTGLCRAGVEQCEDGVARCAGAVTPRVERCTGAGETAADEDCDGQVDEDCDCRNGDVLSCYSGPDDTVGRGVCHAGTQTCVKRVWGSCEGEVVPSAESCANPGSDDDCNGVSDDVAGVDEACYVAANQGICRNGVQRCAGSELECQTRAPEKELCDAVDQDCDGAGYNGFDLSSDATCGASCARCSKTQQCCHGSCVALSSFETDDANCGACGKRCAASQYCCQGECVSFAADLTTEPAARCACDKACGDRSCCGRQCLDLSSDEQNCGGCGIVCGRNTQCCDGVCRLLCVAALGIEIVP